MDQVEDGCLVWVDPAGGEPGSSAADDDRPVAAFDLVVMEQAEQHPVVQVCCAAVEPGSDVVRLGVITCSAPRSLRSSLVPRCDARSLSPSTRTAVLQPGQAQPRLSRAVRIRPSGHRGRTWSRIREHGGGGHGNTVGIRFRAPDRRTIRADPRWPRRGGADRQPEDSAAGWRHHPPWRRRAPVAGRSVHR